MLPLPPETMARLSLPSAIFAMTGTCQCSGALPFRSRVNSPWVSDSSVLPFLQRALSTRMRRSEEHTSELQSLMRNEYAGLSLTKKNKIDQLLTINYL